MFDPFSFFPNFSSKISPQPLKIETLYLVYRSTTTSCIVGLQMGILLFVFLCVCPFFFLSKFVVKDISTTVKDRNFIYGIQVHNDKLYRGIANGHSPICSSFCLFLFLSFQIFRQRYLHNSYGWKLYIWYTGSQPQVVFWIEDGPSICSSFYLFLFLSFQIFVVDISTTVQDRNFKSGVQVHNNKLYHGTENGPSPVCSSYVCCFFFLSRFFVKDTSTTV